MKSKKVLIVDDNALNRRVFEHIIGQLYEYDIAENGKIAIDKLIEGHYDLILMDIQMPVMDGISALKKIINDQLTKSPIIAISAYADHNDKEFFLSTGFKDFISKPIKPKLFLETISFHIDKQKNKYPCDTDVCYEDIDIDLESLKKLLKYNTVENIKTIYDEFIDETEGLLSEIKELINHQAFKNIGDKLHIIKGNSGTLGALKIFNSSKQFEKNIKNEIFENTLKDYLTLNDNLDSFKKHIQTIQILNP
ncbi:response regulator [Belliella sp. DSM 107340]|uniref:Response regulator n=1 Tax=Belliella calami TaxID=2923436 RepID=A0ABS9UJ98_9BACT|nr:hybrid sensor histidine kinase/response regulator [Belliella calami]MCH7396686.1 response regulator [Belliella calami]